MGSKDSIQTKSPPWFVSLQQTVCCVYLVPSVHLVPPLHCDCMQVGISHRHMCTYQQTCSGPGVFLIHSVFETVFLFSPLFIVTPMTFTDSMSATIAKAYSTAAINSNHLQTILTISKTSDLEVSFRKQCCRRHKMIHIIHNSCTFCFSNTDENIR